MSPFVGLLYDRTRVGPLERVTTPPYDTLSAEDQRRFRDLSPHNIVRLDLGEDVSGDDEVENRYARAASELDRWRRAGIFAPVPTASFFPYEMRFALGGRHRRVRGLVCLVELESWGRSIVPHERTLAGPVEDRLRLIRSIRANLSSIMAICSGPCLPLSGMLDEVVREEPAAFLTDEEGVEHRLWALQDDGSLAAQMSRESLMIADGHHRYAMALRYRDEMRALHGSGPWDHVMMLVIDAATEGPPVLPIHRILTAGDPPRSGERVRDLQEVLAEVDDAELVYGTATHEGGELVHRVAELRGAPPTVRALHEQVLDALEGDLLFTPDAVVAEDAVRTRAASAAFFLPGTTAARIRSVVDRGERLPQKSTYFWPKPRTGIVIRPLEPS
jgi:uncharacterized protein (DUF1015 family)